MSTIAFIDAQNLKAAAETLNIKIDYSLLHVWLRKKLKVDRAIMFFGHIPAAKDHYDYLGKAGFELVFRPVDHVYGKIKANVDICLAIHAMDLLAETDRAYLLTADGDFYDLVERWKQDGKFAGVISPAPANRCSKLLKRGADGRIVFLPDIIHKFELRE